jgi:uncharacterized membrane protein (UPF0136 family)
MKQNSILIGCYASLILVGGMIGYLAAHSMISLIASSLFALLLFFCSVLIWNGYLTAYHSAMGLIFCLLFFFVYRFSLTYKMAPAGIMAIISAVLFLYLAAARKQMSRVVR